MTNAAQLVREAIQTRVGEFTKYDIKDDIIEIIPDVSNTAINSAISKSAKRGLIIATGKKRLYVKNRGNISVNKYVVAEGKDWDVIRPYNLSKNSPENHEQKPMSGTKNNEEVVPAETEMVKEEDISADADKEQNENPPLESAEKKPEVSALELGTAIIDFIDNLKNKISEFAEENSRLQQRIRRQDSITEEMVRNAKLERNEHYKSLIKEKDNIIKKLNQRIEAQNITRNIDKGKTFQMGDLARFR